MKIFITGIKGIIGSALAVELMSRGHDVAGCDLFHSYEKNYCRTDIADYRQIEKSLSEFMPDLLYNTAAEFGRWNGEDYYEQLFRSNLIGTKNIIRLAEKMKFKIVHFSSSEIYCDYEDVMYEDVPNQKVLKPLNDYAGTKIFNEWQLRNSNTMYGTQYVTVRPFNSILKDQMVPVLLDDVFVFDTIESVFDRHKNNKGSLSVFGFDPKTGEMSCYSASHLIREKVKKDAYKIKTKFGREVKVTGDHSLFVRGEDGLPKSIEARKIKVNDRIAIPKRINIDKIENELKKIDIIDWLCCNHHDISGWHVKFSNIKDIIKEKKKNVIDFFINDGLSRDQAIKKWWAITYRKDNYCPLNLAICICDIPTDAEICKSKSTKRWIPRCINVTHDFLWLIGFYIAEGSSVFNKKGSFIVFSSGEEDIKKAKQILLDIFNCDSTIIPYDESLKEDCTELRAYNGTLYYVFRSILGCVSKSKNAHVSTWIMTLPNMQIKHFLDGYYAGGGVQKKKNKGSSMLSMTTTSVVLANQLIFILNRFGIVGSIAEYKTNFNGKEYPFFRVEAYGIDNTNISEWDDCVGHNIQSKFDNDIVWAQVKSIDVEQIDDYVYDFSVPNVENFLGGNLVCCHNSFGPGETYTPYRSVACRFCYHALTDIPIIVYKGHKRSSIYIGDMVKTIANISYNFKCGEAYNIANTDRLHTIEELADIIWECTGADRSLISYSESEILTTKIKKADTAKAERDLDHKITISLEDAVERTVSWMEEYYKLIRPKNRKG